MSRTIDPSEALVMLKGHQSNFARMEADDKAKLKRSSNIISILERRVLDVKVMLDLGNGDQIPVRGALSDNEQTHIRNLNALVTNPSVSEEEREEAVLTIFMILVDDPALSLEYFKENRDAWSSSDILRIIRGASALISEINQGMDITYFRDQ